MKLKHVPSLAILVLLNLILVTGPYAQRVTRINPANITLRAVSLSSLWTGMAVGDSGYLVITHTALAPLGGTWEVHHSGFDASITLYAVAYAGDTLHATIGGSNGSLASTSDGGATWHTIPLGTTSAIRALTWNKQGVLVGVGDGGLVIRSTDLGQSWKTIPAATSYQLNAVSFGDANDAVAVGNDTAIVQTHDAGLTWAPMAFPYNFHTMYAGQLDGYVKKIDFTAVVMTGHDSVWVDMDRMIGTVSTLLIFRGDTLSSTYLWDTMGTYFWQSFRNTALLYIGRPNEELISFTSNDWAAGDTGSQFWELFNAHQIGDADGNIDPGTMRFNGAASWKEDTTIVIVAVGENLNCMDDIVTPNGFNRRFLLANWNGLVVTQVDGSLFLDVNILPNGYGYAVGVGEDLERTTDSGRTWTKLTLPITPVGASGTTDSAINSVYTLDSTSAIIVGWGGIIYNVAPTGAGFRGVGVSAYERLEGIAFPSKDTGIIVGDYGTILQSTDRGNTWNTIPTTIINLLYSVAFANPMTGVAVGTYGEIMRTTDEGSSWNEINNQLTQSGLDYRQVQAFPDGTFFARAGTNLLRSTDFGVNWQFVSLPLGVGDTAGMSFYSPEIGIVASRLTSSTRLPDSALFANGVPDTAFFAYTTDGGVTWSQFTIPMWAYNQIIFHWLSDHEVLLYGIYGFIEDVDIAASGVTVAEIDNAPPLQVYPNPASARVRVDYTIKTTGPVQIELWNEAGKKVATLFSSEEAVGTHEHALDLSKSATSAMPHGAYFIRVRHDGMTSTAPISVE